MTTTSFDGGPKDGGPEFVSGPLPVLGPLRTCTKCGEVKTLDGYYKDSRGRFGVQSRCKSCRASIWEKWHAENKTEITQRQRDKYAKDPEYRQRRKDLASDWSKKNIQRRRDLASDWRKKNPEVHRQNARDYYAKNKQGYIEREQARRALMAGAEVSPVDLADLWTGYCALCGETLDYDLKYPDPMSKSLDHDIPLSLGGSHSKENLQWTHLSCNVSKGASI